MAGEKILIVEDEAIVALHEEENLTSLGYIVVGKASSGEEAIRKAEEASPHLVLMDIVLKGKMDGIETAEEIYNRLNIPVIYVTAYGDESTLQRAKLTQPFGYILKPFKERDLHVAIGVALYKHEMESKLRSLERWFAAALWSIGDAVVTTDTEGRVSFMNHLAEKISGWRREDAIGKVLTDVFKMVSQDKIPLEMRHVEQILKEGAIINLPKDYVTCVTREGAEIPIGGCAAPIRDDRGKNAGVVMVFRDFTEQKTEIDSLQKEIERCRHIVSDAPVGIWAVDVNNRSIIVNHKMAALLCYTVEEMAGESLLKFINIEWQGIATEELERRRRGRVEHYLLKFRRKNGSDLLMLVKANPLANISGQYTGDLAIVAEPAEDDCATPSLPTK